MKLNRNKFIKNKAMSAFSLAELSVVITIISILISAIVMTNQARIDATRIFLTKERMSNVIDAIDLYFARYGTLPCPAQINLAVTNANYGISKFHTTEFCDKSFDVDGVNDGDVTGMVPVKTIGIDIANVVDGWGNRFYLVIQRDTANAAAFSASGTNPKVLNFTPTASTLNMKNEGGSTISSATTPLTYIIFSTGPNGKGGYRDRSNTQISSSGSTTAEAENTDADLDFIISVPSKDYDDVCTIKIAHSYQFPQINYDYRFYEI